MKRRYIVNLVIKGHTAHGVYYSDLKINLYRQYTNDNKKNEYNFQELIVDYGKLNANKAARIRNYIAYHLFSLEEVEKLKRMLTDSGDGELEYYERKFPINFEIEDFIFLDKRFEDPVPYSIPPYDHHKCDFMYARIGLCGHFDVGNFELYERKDVKNQEKMIGALQVINDFEIKMNTFITK